MTTSAEIKMAAANATLAPNGAAPVGDGLETGLRPEPESFRVVEEGRRRESNPDLWALDGLSESPSRDIVGARDGP
jgi:hypothetical protein